MFVDNAVIKVKAGNGGNGAVSFRREKYVPDGGPNGGNGGKGGHIIFEVDNGMRTLMDFRYKKQYKALNGENGGKKNKTGKDAPNLVIKVPAGTLIREVKTGQIIADLMEDGQREIIAKGGRGGRGNTEFKTSTRRAPTFSEAGFKGQEFELELELKLIADVGLVGYPNVGKSTLLSVVSKAKPKIGNYHFTTITPNLGVVEAIRGESFVMADIPGLIEGAAEGSGLGHDFLRHIERTRLLVHIVDISACEGRNPIDDFDNINKEVFSYNQKLAKRTMLVVGNKSDIADEETVTEFRNYLADKGYDFNLISAATREGIDELLLKITEKLAEIPVEENEEILAVDDLDSVKPNHFAIEIVKADDGAYELHGEGIERLMFSTDFDDIESLRRFENYLRRRGIFKELREMGIEDGETVRIFDFEFEFYD